MTGVFAMAEGELLDAREAMQILGINENELQTLVARGDLRAFRSAGTMKFRRDDVGSLKSEKSTEPTIIIPAAGAKKTGGSGILPALGGVQKKEPSRIASAVHPAAHSPGENATGEIVLEDIELMPTDDASHTQQVTVQTGIQSGTVTGVGGATVVETGHSSAVGDAITGQMTVMETAQGDATGATQAIPGSGRRQAPPPMAAPAGAPAMSRVQRAAAAPGVSMATSRRTAAVYQPKPAHPFMTALMIVNTIIFTFAGCVCAVMMTRGHYDKVSEQRIIPPFLNHGSSTPVYRWFYKNSPGDRQDKKPIGEYLNLQYAGESSRLARLFWVELKTAFHHGDTEDKQRKAVGRRQRAGPYGSRKIKRPPTAYCFPPSFRSPCLRGEKNVAPRPCLPASVCYSFCSDRNVRRNRHGRLDNADTRHSFTARHGIWNRQTGYRTRIGRHRSRWPLDGILGLSPRTGADLGASVSRP